MTVAVGQTVTVVVAIATLPILPPPHLLRRERQRAGGAEVALYALPFAASQWALLVRLELASNRIAAVSLVCVVHA